MRVVVCPTFRRSAPTLQALTSTARLFSSTPNPSNPAKPVYKTDELLKKLRLHADCIGAAPNFNRWKLVPVSIINHLSLGSIFAWSIFNQPLTRLQGVVAPGPLDWTMGDVSLTFSLVMGGFAWGAVFGKYLERWGPRTACLIGATCLGTGFALGAVAIHTHQLWLLHLGGAVWGLSNGWAYVPPVSTLLKWFPERKGFASGACLLGYGGGAMIAAPMFNHLLAYFRTVPTFLGSAANVEVVNQQGHLFAMVNGSLREVVVATLADVKAAGLTEAGVYLLNSGSTGAASTFLVLGAVYSAVMTLSAFAYRLPPDDYRGSVASGAQKGLTTHNVDVSVGTRTPQFWIMWSGFGLAITGAYGLISTGKTLLVDAFSGAYPLIVTPYFAAQFVGAMSLGNLAGRIVWSNFSDVLCRWVGGDPFYGRKLTYAMMWGLGPPAYLVVVWAIHYCHSHPPGELTVFPLMLFTGSVCGILSCFGGSAATRPAICADLFGTKHVAIMTARQNSVIMPAAMLGPWLANYFRDHDIRGAISHLSTLVTDEKFLAAFGCTKVDLELLVAKKVVTISRLMELVPEGVVDPSPFVYDNGLLVMAAMQAAGFTLNLILRPIPKHLHEQEHPIPSSSTTQAIAGSTPPPPPHVVDSTAQPSTSR